MKDILNSHSVADLKKEISRSNIKGYSKMKKAQVVELMLKHVAKFSHIKMKTDEQRKADAEARKKKPKKEPKAKPSRGNRPKIQLTTFGEEPPKPKAKPKAKPKKSEPFKKRWGLSAEEYSKKYPPFSKKGEKWKVVKEDAKPKAKKLTTVQEKELFQMKNAELGKFQTENGKIYEGSGFNLKEPVNKNKLISLMEKNENNIIRSEIFSYFLKIVKECRKNIKNLKTALKLKNKEVKWKDLETTHKGSLNKFLTEVKNIKPICLTETQLNKIKKVEILDSRQIKEYQATMQDEMELLKKFKAKPKAKDLTVTTADGKKRVLKKRVIDKRSILDRKKK